jgi:hypothetical protein
MALPARRWRGSTSNLSGKDSAVSGYIFARSGIGFLPDGAGIVNGAKWADEET